MAKEKQTEQQTEGQSTAGSVAAQFLDYVLNGTKVSVVLHHGETRGTYTEADIDKRLDLDAVDFPAEFKAGEEGVRTLIGYGLSKLLQDRTSQNSGSPAIKFEAMVEKANRLATVEADGSFQWKGQSERRSSGARGTRAVDGFLAQAVAELKGISVIEASAALQTLDKEKVDALRTSPVIVAKVAELKAAAKEQAQSVDLSDLL